MTDALYLCGVSHQSAGLEVREVLIGHGRQDVDAGARHVEALARRDGPADLDLRVDLAGVGANAERAKPDASVGEIEHVAGRHRLGQAR